MIILPIFLTSESHDTPRARERERATKMKWKKKITKEEIEQQNLFLAIFSLFPSSCSPWCGVERSYHVLPRKDAKMYPSPTFKIPHIEFIISKSLQLRAREKNLGRIWWLCCFIAASVRRETRTKNVLGCDRRRRPETGFSGFAFTFHRAWMVFVCSSLLDWWKGSLVFLAAHCFF